MIAEEFKKLLLVVAIGFVAFLSSIGLMFLIDCVLKFLQKEGEP